MMKIVYQNRPQPGGWSAPETLSSAMIDPASGGLASPGCPPEQVRIEYFVPGTEPREFCALHTSGPEKALKKLVEGIKKIW